MSYLVVGVSYRSADLALLERVALDSDAATKLALAAQSADTVGDLCAAALTHLGLDRLERVEKFFGQQTAVVAQQLARRGLVGSRQELIQQTQVVR